MLCGAIVLVALAEIGDRYYNNLGHTNIEFGIIILCVFLAYFAKYDEL